MSKLSTLWCRHLPKTDKADFESTVRNSTAVLNRLEAILQEYEAKIFQDESTEESYGSGWQYLQAHRNGKKDLLRQLRGLTKHLK